MDDKCMFFIRVRTGSLIFGYVVTVISGIGTLSFTGLLINMASLPLFGGGETLDAASTLAVQILFVECTASFTCTVLLLIGILKNKPLLVMTYIIYGMIHLELLLCVDMLILSRFFLVKVGICMFFCCGIYALLIYMAYLTYKGMIDSGKVYHPQINTKPVV